MRTTLAFCAAGVFMLAPFAAGDMPEPSGAPLYAAFKSFCLDSEARPALIKAAVEAAGGKLVPLPPTPEDVRKAIVAGGGDPDIAEPPHRTTWTITFGGHAMTVENWSDASCKIESAANEDASIVPLVRWADPSIKNPAPERRSYTFVFINVKGRHLDTPSKTIRDLGWAPVGPRTTVELTFGGQSASALTWFNRPENCRPPSEYDTATGGCWCPPDADCAVHCPSGMMLTTEGCRPSCAPGRYYMYGQCLCRPPQVADPATKACICPPGVDCLPPCPRGFRRDAQGTCAWFCPQGASFDPPSGQCRCLLPKKMDAATGLCVCPPGADCSPPCPQGTMRNSDGNCAAQVQCPAGMHNKNGRCVCPPGTNAALVVNGQCAPYMPPMGGIR